MDDEQQKPSRDRESFIGARLAFVSLIGALLWIGLIHLATSLGGQGDGSSSVMSRGWYEFGYSGSIYLGLVFLSCLPFVRGGALVVVGVIAHLVLLCFAIYLISQRWAIILLLPFLAVAGGWILLFKAKRDTPQTKNEED